MFDFLKRTLGGGSFGEEMMQKLEARSQPYVAMGTQIADDCVENGLRTGEIIKLSNIQQFIAKNQPHNSSAVENGFLNRMLEYVNSGEILNMPVQGGDMVFVHKNHVSAFMKEIITELGAMTAQDVKKPTLDSIDAISDYAASYAAKRAAPAVIEMFNVRTGLTGENPESEAILAQRKETLTEVVKASARLTVKAFPKHKKTHPNVAPSDLVEKLVDGFVVELTGAALTGMMNAIRKPRDDS